MQLWKATFIGKKTEWEELKTTVPWFKSGKNCESKVKDL